MSFLPHDYKAPSASDGYMKLQDGENRIRILSAPILGWEDWTLEKKPIRFKMDAKPQSPIDKDKPIKHFWSFIVWNYSEEKIQILQVTQASIRARLEDLTKDEDWGAPFYYDVKIIKKGEGMKTEYNINPMPHKPLAPHIREEFNAKPCYLEALFNGDDPYSHNWGTRTAGVFELNGIKVTPTAIDSEAYFTSFGDDSELMKRYALEVGKFNSWDVNATIIQFEKDAELTDRQFATWKNNAAVPF